MASSEISYTDKFQSASSPLRRLKGIILKVPEKPYINGLLDFRCDPQSSSSESLQSAYEVTEGQDMGILIDDGSTDYFSIYSSDPQPETFKSVSSFNSIDSVHEITKSASSNLSSTFANKPARNENGSLPDILSGIDFDKWSKSLEDIQRKPFNSTPINLAKATSYNKQINISDSKPVTNQGVLQSHAKTSKIGQVVHDLVLAKHEESYKHLLRKLKKSHLSVEENKFRNVIAELESILKKKNNAEDRESGVGTSDSEPESDMKQSSGVIDVSEQRPNGFKPDFSKKLMDVLSCKMPTEVQVYACCVEENKNDTQTNQPVYRRDVGNPVSNQSSEAVNSGVVDIPASEQEATFILKRSESSKSENSEYDEHKFLQAALGEELLHGLQPSSEEYLFPQTGSVSTDNISILLSSRSTLTGFKRRRRKIRKSINNIISSSDYEEAPHTFSSTKVLVDSGDLKYISDLATTPCPYSSASYEDVTNLSSDIFCNEGKKQLKRHIFINDSIIEQTGKMLHYGLRRRPKFVGSHAHLEAERILILSKMRRQVLINYLYKVPETASEAVAKITIENLRCILNTPKDSRPVSKQYFICILQHGTTVYCTRVAASNRLGWVDFGGYFVFENVTNKFSIKIQLYCLNIPRRTKICLDLPFLRSSVKLPMMQLVGEMYVGMLNMKNKKFVFKNGVNDKSKEHKLTASIETSVHWPEPLKGFLTIGTGKIDHQPVWNQRWCVLEDATFKYYDYPSGEDVCSPVGTIDLRSCRSCDEAAEVTFLNNKTLRLFVEDGNDFKRYFISPDSNADYILWSRHLEIILTLIRDWNISKKK